MTQLAADKKLLITIPGQMMFYLDWKKERLRRSKAEIVREAIIKKIRKDKEYQRSIK